MTDKSRNTDPKSDPIGTPAETTAFPVGRKPGDNTRPVDSADMVDLGEDSVVPTYTGPSDTTSFNRRGDHLASDAPTTVTPQPTRQLDREPEYVDYGDTDFAATPVAVPVGEPVIAEQTAVVADTRRGTLDFGLLIIRAAIGIYLIIRGVFTFFTLGGSQGLAGLEAEFAGYQWPEVLAILLPSLELAAGVFLLLGLMTPVAAAVATVATSFTALHQINVHEGGWGELSEAVVLAIILTLVVIGLQFTGPGRISLDAGRGWARRPLVSSWIFVIIGIALAVVLWWFGAGVNPVGPGTLIQP
ncbi:DoxX family protein [Corynebacterium faecale]|uniref:DoxX family protein n=1 Tax=Corynebacterium faecale TaxID=1758466 RepID=UPI003F493B2A